MTTSKLLITDYLEMHAIQQPKKNAIVDNERSITWAELYEEVKALASLLAANLPESNEQLLIGILLPNSWQYVVGYLAILETGHIALPLDPYHKKLEIEAVCQQMQPSHIVTDEAHAHLISDSDTEIVDIENFYKYSKATANYPKLRLSPREQIACLLFTSGTTGKPKAAPYTHANHIWNITVTSKLLGWDQQDTLLVSLPLSHWHGLVMCLTGAIYHGNTLYIQKTADAETTFKNLASGKITIFSQVSIAYVKMMAHQDKKKYDLSRVKHFLSASASLPPAVWQEFKELYDKEIIECYGSSETGRIASNTLDRRVPGSVGKPLPGVQVQLSTDNEIMIKSEGLFPGYYKNDEATNSKYKDGWWMTGDIGEIQDGLIYLKGRVQEKIKKYAYTVYPRDIEWAIQKHPKVEEVFAMGIQELGEINDKIVCYIVGQIKEKEVLEHCKKHLPAQWRPDIIKIIEEMPKTRTGKPQLAKLRAII